LGYLKLDQPTTTLSGDETQRLKIARKLANTPKRSATTTSHKGALYILDEPTRGLNLEDITRLLTVLNQLGKEGNTVLVVEHHLDVIKSADWVIDLGPGGHIVAQGPPEEIANTPKSLTGQYLKPLLSLN
jgi:excinuclease ABC subunit A